MRNFKEILRCSIEQALDDGFAKHIPLTSDYLAEKLLAMLDKTNGELKQMERHQAAIIILRRSTIDKEMAGDEPQSDFDRWVDKQDAAMDMAADMLLDPVSHLTPEELRYAYDIQQHEYDKSDIENELDAGYDDYAELYNIDEKPVTDDEIERMAIELRRLLNNNADACWSVSRTEAVTSILRKRNDN